MWNRIHAGLATALVLLAVEAQGADRYLSNRGSDIGNDCSSASAPCRTIAQAMSVIASSDVLNIARGNYRGFVLVDTSFDLTIRGGWSSDFAIQDPAANKTTLLPLPSDLGGTYPTVVVDVDTGETTTVTIDGVRFRRVSGNSAVRGEVGGSGLLTIELSRCDVRGTHPDSSGSSSPALSFSSSGTGTASLLIADSVVRGNRAKGAGAGVSLSAEGSSAFTATIERSTIRSNSAMPIRERNAGGMYARSITSAVLNLTIRDSVLSRNAGALGAALLFSASDSSTANLLLDGTLIERNRSSGYSALEVLGHFGASATLTATRSAITDNRNGTGLYLMGDGSLDKVRVTRNAGGGGIVGQSNLSLTNSVVAGNRQPSGAAGIDVSGGLTLVNSTVTGNIGVSGVKVYGNVYLTNSIVWGNDGASDLVTSFGYEASHSDLGLVTGFGVLTDLGGNINADPSFVASPDDVHLLPGSPAIDAGTCSGAPADDIDGDPRPAGSSCDIGADEAP